MKRIFLLNLKSSFLVLFLALFVLFFLSLGYDIPSHLLLWNPYALVLILTAILGFKKIFRMPKGVPFSFWIFGIFILFQVVRAGWAYLHLGQAETEVGKMILKIQMESPFYWVIEFLFFGISMLLFASRKALYVFLNLMAGVGFFLAINAVPALLIKEDTVYALTDGKTGFFFPLFYTFSWVPKYIIATFGHPNSVSDVVGLCFFPAAGLLIYSLFILCDKFKRPASDFKSPSRPRLLKYCLIQFLFAALTAAAVFLLLSRGAILFFGLSIAVFLLGLVIKYPSKTMAALLAVVLIGFSGFLYWSGNFNKVQRELKSMDIEIEALHTDAAQDVYQSRSIYTNRAGKRRAMEIYKDHPVWGVGTGGYAVAGNKYPDQKGWEGFLVARFYAMSHYFQMLAEEGVGAWIYFLFLFVYVLEIIYGLSTTRSRFQFVSALSLFAAVFMVFCHASINQLLERFAMSMLVYIPMGVSLAALRKDFDHEAVKE